MSWRTRKRGSSKQRGTRFKVDRKYASLPRMLQKIADLTLKKQTQDGLAKIFEKLGARGVANEIRQGRDITGNAEYGICHMVHDKLGPRVNVETWKFSPQSKKARRIEERFVENVNLLLKNAGFPKMSPTLLSDLREKDKEFERKVKARKASV